MSRGAVTVVLALVVTVSACGGGRAGANPFSRGRGAPTAIQIFVDNQNFSDMTLLAVTTRGRQPLGRIGGVSQRSFTLNWQGLDGLRIRIEVLAGQDYETNIVNASPGDRLELTGPRDPRNSYLRRRR